jgi:hypothetical protein
MEQRTAYMGSRAIRRAIFELRLSFLANYIQAMLTFFLLKLLLKSTKNEAPFLKVAVSYCPRHPVVLEDHILRLG